MYVNNPEFLARAQAHYPGAYALVVDRLGSVWARCDKCQWDEREIPGGSVELGSNPEMANLRDEILAEVFKGA
jgi:hypothetical protein